MSHPTDNAQGNTVELSAEAAGTGESIEFVDASSSSAQTTEAGALEYRQQQHPQQRRWSRWRYLLPLRRIPRYKLLLHNLLEGSWSEHSNHQDIAKAPEKISSRADEMDEWKHQHENHEKAPNLEHDYGQYKTPLIPPHSKVVRKGILHLFRVVTRNVSMGVNKALPTNGSTVGQVGTVHPLSEGKVKRSYLFILFNDNMIQYNTIAASDKSGGSAFNELRQ
ncbi:hypothetical protein B0O80DRAFT_503614 [Mortierella sp. GBAus27b]|nr:hypothetical protein B0O80DRAFT_503614 [Mortierella sp. GBAus27b]